MTEDKNKNQDTEKPTKKRKSRFDDVGTTTGSSTIDPNLALAKAAEISKNILNSTLKNSSSVLSIEQQNAIKAAEMQSQLASQIANVTSLLKNVQQQNPFLTSTAPNLALQIQQSLKDKKTSYRPLLLDSQGREIDEQGNLVKSDFTQVKTLAVNNQIIQAQRKKENPYLAHKQIPQASASQIQQTIHSSLSTSTNELANGMASVLPKPLSVTLGASSVIQSGGGTSTVEPDKFVDSRVVLADRSIRSKRALHFHEPGKIDRI